MWVDETLVAGWTCGYMLAKHSGHQTGVTLEKEGREQARRNQAANGPFSPALLIRIYDAAAEKGIRNRKRVRRQTTKKKSRFNCFEWRWRK